MATNISVPTAALREYTKTAPCLYTEAHLKQAGRRAKVDLDFTKVSRQQGIVISKETVRELAQKYNLSGRSIRNVLRLTRAHMLLKNDGDETVPLEVEDVDFCYDVSARLKHEGLRTT